MKLNSLTGSRVGRVALAAVPVGVAASLLLGGVAQGAVPVSFAVSGKAFKISADELTGTGFSQYAGIALTTAGMQGDPNGRVPVALSNITDATLKNLCQSVDVLGPIGTHQQELGPRRQGVVALQQEFANLPTRPGSTRLTRQHDGQSRCSDLISDGPGGGRFARSVDPLEGDEYARHRAI